MKHLKYLLIAIIFAFSSCDKYPDPTYDVVLYDIEQSPTIIAEALPSTMLAGESFEWGVEIYAYNCIETILFNDEVLFTYGNGQFTHNAGFTLEMPDDGVTTTLEVNLTVVDELGNTTTLYPETQIITVSGTVPTSTLIFNPSEQGEVVTDAGVVLAYATKNYLYVAPSEEGTEVKFGVPWMTTILSSYIGYDNSENAITFSNYYNNGSAYTCVNNSLYFVNEVLLEQAIDEDLITALVGSDGTGGNRNLTLEIYVDTVNTTDGESSNFSYALHNQVAMGLACQSLFNNTSNANRAGQKFGTTAYITQTDGWQTLVFSYHAGSFAYQASNMSGAVPANDQIDMFTLFLSPQSGTINNTSSTHCNATYKIRNLKIEKVE